MDSAYPSECWISEPEARFNLNSPGLSSGYCSAEENHLHSKYNTSGDVASSSRFRGQIDLDSPWRGQSPSLVLSSTTNPCLSGDASGGMITVSSQDSLPDLKNSLSFDDLMDTLYDPFGDVARTSDFPACDTLSDIEMTDTDCCMFLSRGGSSTLNQNAAVSSVNSDSSLISYLKNQELGTINVNQTNGRFCTVGTSPGQPPQQLAAISVAGKYAAVPVRSSLALDQQSSHSVVNVSRSNGLCSTVSSLHQHMADMNDMSAPGGDASDYVLRFVAKSNTQPPADKSVEAIIKHPVSSAAPAHNSAILGGVFSQRGTITSLRTCEPKALGRIKGGTVATSCGTLLRHSVSIPNSLSTSSVQASKENGKPMLDSKIRNGLQTSVKANNCDRAISSCDMRGGRATSVYPGLDDHRYTLKQVPSNQNVAKLRKSGGAHASNPSFSGRQEGCVRTTGGATSILEAFLRSTRPMDPNKGSNAALAAEGLSYLRLDERQTKEKPDSSGLAGNGGGGMLLKKLLTGEIDQGQALLGHRGDQHEEDHLMIHDRLLCPSLPIDSPLTDGFGLDLSLDDSQIMGMGLMGAGDIPDITESIWLGDLSDELAVSELDEILREQARQEDLWVEHYGNLV